MKKVKLGAVPIHTPQSIPTSGHIVAVIGSGYSGTLSAINILKHHPDKNVEVILVERALPFGRGLAYGTSDDNLLLNVPAGSISAFSDDMQHFVRYCQKIDPAFNADRPR